jgi:hypothetical protein
MLSKVVVAEFVIEGITSDGIVFQSTDWAERLCDSLTRSGADGRKVHPSYACPLVIEGVKCVVVRATLRKDNTTAFELIKRYVVENRLRVRAGRGGGDYIESTIIIPAYGTDRRDQNNDSW